ncbi:ribonuclease E/G [Afifella sp. IM 167]|uniref:Rne/Rng family ribonuclease n=1 Tax=Afifella sp. IM 167 TaxID=2033586 RepID=UPI001CCA0C86|nr:ribonuclease E/G [Afifella sp. IM 167]MBZ8132233.1 ribonuclease E/G [Afifella sp. IM 167]
MSNKMLIDAAHPEETRVVVLRGDKVEEFDFESAERRQLRGNIYLAKVTRVEPSLQAAFVDYGGNRHGFLAFSEIHPDYYQIPFADRQALLAEEADDDHGADEEAEARSHAAEKSAAAEAEEDSGDGEEGENDSVESVGAEDAMEEVPERRRSRPRQYKIQEVIKRRQVLLVQVVKEERGNKGAALTTYLSLAGRYSVLMPNTGRGGGISRKITDPSDRKRLKAVAQELEVPSSMGVILRTAGASRTKTEIKRDFEYLLRLWENVRELTLQSAAPTLVYEEGSLVKRSIRDLYSREIDQVTVAGEEAYREAKDFMRMLMPSHAKNVQPYRETAPLFSRYSVEKQLEAMFVPQVTLKSGGYIVINQTEALVAIDVNSGRSTREHSIEDTALRTNLEASEEVARQLRLRDLAGLIVIDFIDMEEKRNNRAVERKLKDCLRFDRARIQLGRISHFGLMEMSRQRLRTGVVESSTSLCHVCHGTGQVRSVASLALQILRMAEEHLLQDRSRNLVISTRPDVSLYVLNQKRIHLAELEQRFGVFITVNGDAPGATSGFIIEKADSSEAQPQQRSAAVAMLDVSDFEEEEERAAPQREEADEESGESGEGSRRGRRRRRPRRGERDRERVEAEAETTTDSEDEGAESSESGENREARGEDDDSGEETPRKKRRRGRRGGRRRGRNRDNDNESRANDGEDGSDDNERDSDGDGDDRDGDRDDQDNDRAERNGPDRGETQPAVTAEAVEIAENVPSPSPEASEKPAEAEPAEEEKAAEAREEPVAEAETAEAETAEAEKAPAEEERQPEAAAEASQAEDAKPAEAAEARGESGNGQAEPEEAAASEAEEPAKEPEAAEEEDPNRPKRVGWWQRRSFL